MRECFRCLEQRKLEDEEAFSERERRWSIKYRASRARHGLNKIKSSYYPYLIRNFQASRIEQVFFISDLRISDW